MNIELTKANDSDLEFLIKLRSLTMANQLNKIGIILSQEENLLRVKSNFESIFIIQQLDENIGMIKYIKTENFIEIIQFQILPSYQRKGVGKYVINQLCLTAKSSDKKLKLKVLKDNPAKKLYEQFNFVVVDSDEHEFHMQYDA